MTTAGLESNKDSGAGLEKIQGVIINAAYRIHAGVKTESDESCKPHQHPAAIVDTVLRSKSTNPGTAAIKETSAGGRVGPESASGKFQPEIRTVEKGPAVGGNKRRDVRDGMLQTQRSCSTIQPYSEYSKVIGVNLNLARGGSRLHTNGTAYPSHA